MPLLIPCTERDSLFKILPLKMNHFHRYDETDNFFTGNLTILKKCENLFTGKLLKGILSSIGTKRHHRCLLFYIFYVTVTLNGTRLYHTFLVDSFFCALCSLCLYLQLEPNQLPCFSIAPPVLCYKTSLLLLNAT